MRIVLSIFFITIRGSRLITHIFISVKNTFEKKSWVIHENNSFELRRRPDETNHIKQSKGFFESIS